MIDRALIMKDETIVDLLKAKFIPVAIDVVHHQHRRDAEGKLYRGFAVGSGQGLYACQADGQRLGFSNHRGVDRTRQFLERALDDFKPTEGVKPKNPAKDRWWVRRPPIGGLVVNVTCKVLGGYEGADRPEDRIHAASIGRDRLWVRKSEQDALARDEFPVKLARRIARFHLIDNTRGTPRLWKAEEIKAVEVSLNEGEILGSVHLESESGKGGYKARFRGVVEQKEGRVTKFDLVAKGEFWGEGQYTKGAPKGPYPFAVAFTLSSGEDESETVPPFANSWDPDEYLR